MPSSTRPLAGLVAASLDDTTWLGWLAQPGWIVWPGLLCGLLLGQARWRGWAAAGYSLLLSAAAGLQVIGQWLPAAAQLLTEDVMVDAAKVAFDIGTQGINEAAGRRLACWRSRRGASG